MATRRRLWLVLPPMLLIALDLSMTMLGQPHEYWQGDYASVKEWNPLVKPFLQYHPAAFLILFTAHSALVFFALIFLPWRIAIVGAFLVALGHMIGAASWIIHLGALGWILTVALMICTKALMNVSWKKSGVT